MTPRTTFAAYALRDGRLYGVVVLPDAPVPGRRNPITPKAVARGAAVARSLGGSPAETVLCVDCRREVPRAYAWLVDRKAPRMRFRCGECRKRRWEARA